jgi:hypothetical protein
MTINFILEKDCEIIQLQVTGALAEERSCLKTAFSYGTIGAG